MGFLILKMICWVKGHQWVDDPNTDTYDREQKRWRPARVCRRCFETR